MRTFADNAGRTWSVVMNVDALKRVQSLAGVNLVAEMVDGKLFERLAVDPVLLCNVLYALCKPQADAAKVTDEQFGQAMAGDAIQAATTALLEELVDFFPNRRRSLLRKALTKMNEIDDLELAVAETKLDGLEPARISGGLSGNSPASSEQTPAP